MKHTHFVLALNSTLWNASLTSATAVEGAETLEPESGAPLILTHLESHAQLSQFQSIVLTYPMVIKHGIGKSFFFSAYT